MKICCLFSYDDVATAAENFNFTLIQDLGDKVYNKDGSVKHRTYVWDKGGRSVLQCKKCGAFFINQWTDYFGPDGDYYYSHYFLVKDLEEAIYLNDKYGGLALETECRNKGLAIWESSDIWYWNKETKLMM